MIYPVKKEKVVHAKSNNLIMFFLTGMASGFTWRKGADFSEELGDGNVPQGGFQG